MQDTLRAVSPNHRISLALTKNPRPLNALDLDIHTHAFVGGGLLECVYMPSREGLMAWKTNSPPTTHPGATSVDLLVDQS